MMCLQSSLYESLLWLGPGKFWIEYLCGMQQWVCPSACPVVRKHTLSALYSSHETMDGIYYVNGMLAMPVVCITALVGTWSALNRVYMGYGTVGVSVSPSAHPFLPCTVATSLWMVSTMFMGC